MKKLFIKRIIAVITLFIQAFTKKIYDFFQIIEANISQTGTSLSQTGTSLSQTGISLNQTGTSLSRTGISLNQTGASLSRTGISLNQTGASLSKTGTSNKYSVVFNGIMMMVTTTTDDSIKTDWIPEDEPTLYLWSIHLLAGIASDIVPIFAPYQKMVEDFGPLSAAHVLWIAKYSLYNENMPRTHAQVIEKNEAKEGFVTLLRQFYTDYIYRKKRISNAIRENNGLPLLGKEPIPAPVPDSKPVAEKLASLQHDIVSMIVKDEKTLSKLSWKWQLVEAWGKSVAAGVTPPSPSTFTMLEVSKSHKLSITMPEGSRGTVLYLRLRFSNGPNKKGPWSDLYSVVIS